MFKENIPKKEDLLLKHYDNGDLAIFLQDEGYPVAEISLKNDNTNLLPNEFILKSYSENALLLQYIKKAAFIKYTNSFLQIGNHLCPICRLDL